MRVTKPGEIVKFGCGACGCEFVDGINAAKTNDKGENYYCHCPTCGSECHADMNKRSNGEMSEAEMIFFVKNGDDAPENAYMQRYAVEKPLLGCAPYYIKISTRICDLCEAIKRYSTAGGKHDKIKLWAYEILQLNEMDRNLRYEEKRKVWKEDKYGKLQEMP